MDPYSFYRELLAPFCASYKNRRADFKSDGQRYGQASTASSPRQKKGHGTAHSTLREVAEFFLAEHAEAKRKRSTATQYRDILKRLVLPTLGSRKIEKVTVVEVAKLHTKMKDHPYQANRIIAVVGSLYSFAGRRSIAPLGFNVAAKKKRVG
jgi:hypothetical protein